MHFKPFLMKKKLSLQAKNGLWDLVSGRVGPPETKSQDPQVQKFFFCLKFVLDHSEQLIIFYHFSIIWEELVKSTIVKK